MLAHQVAFNTNLDLIYRKEDNLQTPILIFKLFIHVLWTTFVFTKVVRWQVKIHGLDLKDYLYSVKVQIQIFFTVFDWWLGTHLPKGIYLIGAG